MAIFNSYVSLPESNPDYKFPIRHYPIYTWGNWRKTPQSLTTCYCSWDDPPSISTSSPSISEKTNGNSHEMAMTEIHPIPMGCIQAKSLNPHHKSSHDHNILQPSQPHLSSSFPSEITVNIVIFFESGHVPSHKLMALYESGRMAAVLRLQ